MSMNASIHGRAVFDPKVRQTKTGKPMTTARLAVDVTGNTGENETLWLDVLAFGDQAAALARVTKGESVSAIGRVTRSKYAGKDGIERESWSMLADAVLTIRSARPGQRRQPSNGARQSRPQHDPQAPFNDPIGF